MSKFLVSILLTATVGVGAAGCKSSSASNSGEPMKMNAAMACCGDACKKMGSDCCKADDKGTVTCSMGGNCCVKTDKTKM